MQFNIFDKISKFLNWFIDFIAKPLGMATWSIVLVLGAGYYGEYQREKAISETNNEKLAYNVRIKQLESKVDTLSTRLANKDCTDEIQKYINVIQTIQIQTSQNRDEVQKRLELEKRKTMELEKLKQSLNMK